MSNIYLYKNKLWKVKHEFLYTGQREQFTLNPGKYLFICNGASGGSWINSTYHNIGGSSYGVLTLNEITSLYAYVGGNGENAQANNTIMQGGFNGGGHGGLGQTSSSISGPGGGGASDIRLDDSSELIQMINPDSVELPEEYTQLLYIQHAADQYIDTGFILKSDHTVYMDLSFFSYKSNSFFIGQNSINSYTFYGGITSTSLSSLTTAYGFNYIQNQFPDTNRIIAYGTPTQDLQYSLIILGRRTGTSSATVSTSAIRLFGLKITNSNGDVLMNLVPCYRNEDNRDGVYDLVSGNFLTGNRNQNFGTRGPEIPRYLSVEKSMFSRIIVAGGGGGCGITSLSTTSKITGFGGGVNGGFISSGNPIDENYLKYASQSSGYSFGYGMDGPNRSTKTTAYGEGFAGGGGGWYGGYATSSVSNQPGTSGGGSGYVLTEDSYKPAGYMDGFDIEKYYMEDVKLLAGTSEQSSVIVCEETQFVMVGDKIICPFVGEMNQLKLLPGEYKLSCWGGAGGTRYDYAKASVGGFASGIIKLENDIDAFIYVGGSGLYASCYNGENYIETTFPSLSFNGGGIASTSITSFKVGGVYGGGASDIRLGEDSYNNRVIVAGGGGGMGYDTRVGGNGGGLSGVSGTSAGYGTNYGPGTQTSSGTNMTQPQSGGFGFGGIGFVENSGFGGAGGGGWFGGSGTKPNTSLDNENSGSGGSGYVLTETSYKPEGYMDGYNVEKFYMEDTVLTTGGNSLPNGITKIEIECLNIELFYILAYDEEGYKYLNNETNTWEFLKIDLPSIDEFMMFGCHKFNSDNGLLNDYQILIYDIIDELDSLKYDVLPLKQTIKLSHKTKYSLLKSTTEMDYDKDNVDIDISYEHTGVAELSRLNFNIDVDIKDEPNVETRIYCLTCYTKGSVTSTLPTPKEKTLDHIDLLPVGSSNVFPSRYKNYIGGFIGDVEIASIDSAVCCEHGRNIYAITSCNNTTARISRLNLITNESNIIKDIPKSLLGNINYGGFLVDGKYAYITSSYNDHSSTIYRIPLSADDNTVTKHTTYSSIEAFGKMEWFNKNTIIINHYRGYDLFNTETLTFEHIIHPTSNLGARNYMAIGKKLWISMNASESTGMTVYDYEAGEFKSDYNISVPSAVKCVCYNEGKFYITQANYIYIYDEDTHVIEKTIPTPYSNKHPYEIFYTNGILYITIKNSSIAYAYDIANNRFNEIGLPFTMPSRSTVTGNNFIGSCVFKNYLFIPQIKLFVVNTSDYAKYAMGYISDQFILPLNENTIDLYNIEYDNNYVSFDNSSMIIRDGYINYKLKYYDEESLIKYAIVDKSKYNKLLSCIISFKENDDENYNEGDDNNG